MWRISSRTARGCAAAVVLSVPLASVASSGVVGADGVPLAASTAGATIDLTLDPGADTAPAPVEIQGALDSAELLGRSEASPRRPEPTGVSLKDLDIPSAAFSAYVNAARAMRKADAACGLEWSLLAAIGRVESDHGRYAGARLGNDGVSAPVIRGVALDGSGPWTTIRDTDAGRLDGDTTFDRAVGPMQFIPSTWATVGVDGDADGVRSPDDLDDAALAAAVYLCSAGGDLGTADGRAGAVYRYNHSAEYVATVLRLERAYRNGRYEALSVGVAPSMPVAVPLPSATRAADGGTPGLPARPGHSVVGGHHGAGDRPGGGKDGKGQQGGRDHRDDTRGGASVTDGHDNEPDWTPDPTPTPTPTPEPTPEPTPTPEPEPSPTPDPTPTQEPTPTPAPEPTCPVVDTPASTDPATTPPLLELTGVLTLCDTSWLVDDTLLDVGDDTWLAGQALADLDADGIVETNGEELAGLEGAQVVVGVATGSSPAVVYTLDGLTYRP